VCGSVARYTLDADRSVGENVLARLVTLGCVLFFAQGCAANRSFSTTPRGAPSRQTMTFVATAYCHGTTTTAGASVRGRIVAADPTVLPLGTVIRLQRAGRYNGSYTVLDTGAKVQGHRVDLFIRDCREAVRFGRRTVRVSIVRRSR
jgi:3D (Asp-Asp-Asp) domain-containing protein